MDERSVRAQSYASQANVYTRFSRGGAEEALAKTWLDKTTVDAWRHGRMYGMLLPIVHSYPRSRWLTVGDGRYGCDAAHLISMGMDALATDIGDVLLQEALEVGHIAAYRKENAESLSFKDEEFDFVLCKESYHHCPRPMVALYEMLRVASKAVILIEPNDPAVNSTWTERTINRLLSAAKRIIGCNLAHVDFEEAGNYVYSVSKREMEKAALGIGLLQVAFKGMNDHYVVGVECEKTATNGRLFRKVRSRIGLKNLMCRFRLRQYDLLATIMFKTSMEESVRAGLTRHGYQVVSLPQNPFSQRRARSESSPS